MLIYHQFEGVGHMLRRTAIVSALVSLLWGAGGRAQQLPPPDAPQNPLATFRADANFVEIDAVVTDERGNPVTNLSRDDFQIFEDGKRQTPSVFALINLPQPSPAAIARAAAVEPDVRSTRRTFDGRIYVLVLDDLHTTIARTPIVRNAARRFIEQYAGPDDLVAVVPTSGRLDGAQELTSNHRLLLQAVDRFMGQKLPSAVSEKLAAHLLERSVQAPSSDPSTSSTQSQNRDPIADPNEAERAMNARSLFDLVTNLAGWMTDVQGRRKAMVLFSEGIDYDIYDVFNNRSAGTLMDRARDAIAAAQRANVSVYAIDPRGLTGAGDDTLASASSTGDPDVPEVGPGAFGRELLLSQESLISRADETGGTAAVRSNDIPGALARISRETSTYYLLGYHSDSSRSPGRFRKIDVRVTRPGLKVRARRGYMAPKATVKPRETPAAGRVSPALLEALKNPLPVGTLPVRVFAAPFKGEARNGSVLLAVELSGPDLKFERRGDVFSDQIEISLAAVNYQGKLADSKLQVFNLSLKPDVHAITSRGGIRLLERLNLPPARYQIRVGAHDSVGNGVGTVSYDIEIPDYSKTPFALSGVILISSNSGNIMTLRPDPQLKDVLAAPPTAVRIFGRRETLTLAFQVYDDSSRLAHTVDVTTTVRSADNDRVVFKKTDERPVPAGAKSIAEWCKVEIPLADVAPGKYLLSVQAASRVGSNTAVQQLPFEVGN
jgi:VWFA-related protein